MNYVSDIVSHRSIPVNGYVRDLFRDGLRKALKDAGPRGK